MSDPTSRAPGIGTRAVHVGDPPHIPGEPVGTPLVRSATFFSDPDGPVRYQRYGNGPNHVALEARLAALDGGEDAMVVASGMAAMVCAALAYVQAGDHVVCTDDVYGGTRVLLEQELPRYGVTTTFVDMLAPGWEAAFRPNTRLVIAESPSNPLLRVLDIAAIARGAHAHGCPLVVDATFASPVNFRPLEHGADLVMHSATKYLGGHSDLTAGVLVGSHEHVDRARDRAKVWGPLLDPSGAWLLERGVKTLSVRMQRHNENGIAVARWAEGRPGIERVVYPGLESHPDHARAAALLDGFGGMLGLQIEGGAEAGSAFVAALHLAKAAPSLGGVETLVSEPRFTSHAAMTPEARAAAGMPDGFVRLSLGIEDAADLIADVEQALAAVADRAVVGATAG